MNFYVDIIYGKKSKKKDEVNFKPFAAYEQVKQFQDLEKYFLGYVTSVFGTLELSHLCAMVPYWYKNKKVGPVLYLEPWSVSISNEELI